MRRAGWLVLLVGLGLVGLWLAAPDAAVLRVALARMADAPIATALIVVGGALVLVLAEVVRIVVIGRLLGASIRPRDAFDAAIANQVMAAVTPTVGLGEPSVAYILGKRGIGWDIAVAIPFIKFTTSLALVFAIGAALGLAGQGPPVAGWITGSVLALFLAVAVGTTLFVVVCSRPDWTGRVTDRLRGWLAARRWLQRPAWQDRIERGAKVLRGAGERLAHLRRRRTGGNSAVLLGLVHLVYYAAYVAPLVTLALVLGDPPVLSLTLRSVVYLCFMFAIPTPGGAGGAEAVAGLFFADLVPPADALAIVAVFRASTFYLQVAIGVVYVPLRKVLSA